jgi:peptidoglycan hydrolase-like amidase
MILSSFLKKSALIISLFLIGINPVLAETEPDPFASTTASAEFFVDTSSTPVLQAEEVSVPGRVLIDEPIIRVGLYKTSESIKFKSEFTYEVWSGGQLRGTIPGEEMAEINYKEGLYNIKSASLEFGSKDYFRLVPEDPANFFSLVNYTRPIAGRNRINFNMYRGTLEYRYSPKSKLPYIINELPLDLYVKGIAETSDAAPVEYMKALSVAARSYAHAFIVKTPPTEKRMFDVYATTADQLYLGYNSELFMPKFASAAMATAGELVTYNNNPVITFYFSHSNGKTSNGGKDRPWLKSVVAIYDKGNKMLGHGIGMSNNDAQKRASKDGWDYKQILEYYYTSTTVERVF